jgi:hypothetical protein
MVVTLKPHPNIQGLFSGKRGAGTHKRGKNKHTESFVTISLHNITMYLHIL